jgi:hypothetical protein
VTAQVDPKKGGDFPGGTSFNSFKVRSGSGISYPQVSAAMPPKFDPNEVKILYLRATGGEVGSSASLAPKIGPLGLSPKKVGEDIAKVPQSDLCHPIDHLSRIPISLSHLPLLQDG